MMLSERQWRNVDVSIDGCWVWTRKLNHDGYARTRIGGGQGRHVYVHRALYEHLNGPLPDGYELDHLCRNRACVRPDHMEPVTHAENVKRGDSGKWLAAKTHCPRGHPYEGDNLEYTAIGGRMCVICRRKRDRERRRRKRRAERLA